MKRSIRVCVVGRIRPTMATTAVLSSSLPPLASYRRSNARASGARGRHPEAGILTIGLPSPSSPASDCSAAAPGASDSFRACYEQPGRHLPGNGHPLVSGLQHQSRELARPAGSARPLASGAQPAKAPRPPACCRLMAAVRLFRMTSCRSAASGGPALAEESNASAARRLQRLVRRRGVEERVGRRASRSPGRLSRRWHTSVDLGGRGCGRREERQSTD